MTASYRYAAVAVCIYAVLIGASCRAVCIGVSGFAGSMAPGAVGTATGVEAVAATMGFDIGSLEEWVACVSFYGAAAVLSLALTRRREFRKALAALRRGAPARSGAVTPSFG